jgi:hypothetical protein
MISHTNDARRVTWVVKEGIPHWKSQELASLRGSDRTGVDCPEHGSHNAGEMVAYAWIKHRQFCPLGMRQILKGIDDQSPPQGPRK